MDAALRDSGIDEIGKMPWGTHVCQFYENRADLFDILVPYFRSGLAANEYCMWVTSDPLSVDDAKAALRRAVPDLEDRIARGQMEILPHDRWYLENETFDFERVLNGWVKRLDDARARGYEGLRVTGNTAWLEKSRWDDFTEYERQINGVMGSLRMMAICTYAVGRCGAKEVIDVVGNHQFALVKRGESWQAVEDSQRKRMAEALRESEKRLRLLFEHMTSGCAYHQVVLEDDRPVDYVFVEANPAFERQTGLHRDQIIGKRVTEVLPGIQNDFDWIGTYSRVARTGEPVRFERHSEALRRWYSVSAYSPAKDSFVALFDDVTERRLADEQRDDLIRAVTHDLRTPLSVISTSAQLMLSQPDAAASRAEPILRSCRSMDALLSDLAETARLDSGRIELEHRSVDMGALLSDVVRRLAPALDTGRIRVHVSPGPAVVKGDPDRLERVVVNLLTNALKYSTRGTEVLLEAGAAGGKVSVAVTDRGDGIHPDDLPRIFDRFFRARHSRPAHGLGLGLYIARMLVEAHGGTIRAESTPGAGSRFEILLPAAATAHA